ncbi:MAG: double-strand break repair protein AddB, partial [Alphaproteobacteria bacterium]|nr:double-strand break repair protein AddB [Alphaproteobacteria bacterium]
ERAGFAALLAAHVAAAEALSAPVRLWAGEAGEALAEHLAALRAAAADLGEIAPADYGALFETLLAEAVVRPRQNRHPRLHIWGQLEARLQRADRLILGGLNEGSWPGEIAPDPWLSRPMMARLGLGEPERRIGLAAHDFALLAAAPEVLLSHARKAGGTPQVPSRWLSRLVAYLKGHELKLPAAAPFLAWQAELDAPARVDPVAAPAPAPPLGLRPRRLSISDVALLQKNPYAFFAHRVLKLEALAAVGAAPDLADRGRLVHEALDRFRAECPGALPKDALARLLRHGRAVFAPHLAEPRVFAFWWPRFERVAAWVLDRLAEDPTRVTVASEVKGRLNLDLPAGAVTLTGKADRIDRLADGRLAIVDYKTGSVPARTKVESGAQSQLPLEAAIAEHGGFDGVKAGAVALLEYWRIGGGEPPGEIGPVFDRPAELAAAALDGLERLLRAYDDPATPYRAQEAEDDYARLARLREWSGAEDGR